MFLAEGEKMVKEIISARENLLHAEELFITEDFYDEIQYIIPVSLKVNLLTHSELKKISQLTAPHKALLLMRIPEYKPDPSEIVNSCSLVFENINDPGNLGTIMRTADWFGIRNIFCSPGSVDLYNPKVIQSTMGAICRVKVHYTALHPLLTSFREDYNTNIAGTLLDGMNIENITLPAENCMIVFGNESRGISPSLRKCLTCEIKIPSFPSVPETSESLNIASAVAIMCWETRRRNDPIRNEN